MHIAELTAVALIKDNYNLLVRHGVPCVLFDECAELLNGCNYNFCVGVFKLPFKNCGRCIAVRRTLFKAVVLLHRLIVQIFSVDDKEHFIYIIEACCKLCGLEGRQSFTAAGGMPYIAASLHRAVFFVIVGNFNAIEYSLGCRNLIGTHHQKHILSRKHAILREYV